MRATGVAVSDGRNVFVDGVDADTVSARMVERTAAARGRVRRVAEFIRAEHPALERKTIELAEQALAGRWILPGTSGTPTFIGNPPQWSTPRFENEEYLWMLNRMPQWKPLLEAYTLTGDDRYAAKVASELDDWIAHAHPSPVFLQADGKPDLSSIANSAPPPWRSLELGIRLFETWPRVIDHLAGTPHLPPARLERMLRSMAVQADGLATVTPAIWPDADHNHFFMEMLGLLSAAQLCPEFLQSPQWTAESLRELERCVRTQFTADGGHVEGCPMYHNVCVVLLSRYLLLARAADAEPNPRHAALCAAAALHSVHATRPSGQTVPWGDSVPHTYYDLPAVWAYRVTGDIRPLQHVGQMIGPEALRRLCLSEIWEIDDPREFYRRMVTAPVPPFEPLHVDRGNDQVMLRTTWRGDALSIFFACHSPLHPGSGHQHIDLGGFDLCAFGRALVVDPGPFTYRECADRKVFKSAAYHSVLTVNDRDPFAYISRWRYTPQKSGRVSHVSRKNRVVRIESVHDNYAPVSCRRILALVDDRALVVIDRVEGLSCDDTLQIYFHLDSLDVSVSSESRRVASRHGDVSLAIETTGGMSAALLPGRISENWEVSRPSTRLQFSDDGFAPARRHAAVLVPFRSAAPVPRIEAVCFVDDGSSLRFELDGKTFSVRSDALPES